MFVASEKQPVYTEATPKYVEVVEVSLGLEYFGRVEF
jgi:hypothetical protein